MRTYKTKEFSAGKDLPQITAKLPLPESVTAEGIEDIDAYRIFCHAVINSAKSLAKVAFGRQNDEIQANLKTAEMVVEYSGGLVTLEQVIEKMTSEGKLFHPTTDLYFDFDDLYPKKENTRGKKAEDVQATESDELDESETDN